MPKITLLETPYPGEEVLSCVLKMQKDMLGLTREEMSIKLGWSMATISSRMKRPTSMSLEDLADLCRVLRIQPEYAFLTLRQKNADMNNHQHWQAELAAAVEGRR